MMRYTQTVLYIKATSLVSNKILFIGFKKSIIPNNNLKMKIIN